MKRRPAKFRASEAQHREIGEKLRTWRESVGLSQVALADRMGISRPFVSYYEHGTRKRMGRDTLKRLIAVVCELSDVDPPAPVSIVRQHKKHRNNV